MRRAGRDERPAAPPRLADRPGVPDGMAAQDGSLSRSRHMPGGAGEEPGHQRPGLLQRVPVDFLQAQHFGIQSAEDSPERLRPLEPLDLVAVHPPRRVTRPGGAGD